MHGVIRDILKNPDPYKEIKSASNRKMLALYPDLKKMVLEADDQFDLAMRLAIAGNVIDFGPQRQLDVTETMNSVVNAELMIDDSRFLREDLEKAKTVLYVGDNCGEIVMDKLFLETINHPNLFFAVRAGAVINDATVADAEEVGIDNFSKVITTGDNAPGAV